MNDYTWRNQHQLIAEFQFPTMKIRCRYASSLFNNRKWAIINCELYYINRLKLTLGLSFFLFFYLYGLFRINYILKRNRLQTKKKQLHLYSFMSHQAAHKQDKKFQLWIHFFSFLRYCDYVLTNLRLSMGFNISKHIAIKFNVSCILCILIKMQIRYTVHY